MNRLDPFVYQDRPAYGWPFYMARKILRRTGGMLLRAADHLSMREKYPFPDNFRPLLPRNAELRNRHHGRRCFVLGTGPSLAGQDLSPLTGEITLGLNAFIRHPLIETIQPTYYLFADPVFFDGSDSSRAFLRQVRTRTAASTFVVPSSAARGIAAGDLLPPERTHYVAFAGMLKSARLRRIDLTRTIPSVWNCAQLAIMTAIYLGCSPIYLLGLDHDWLAHRGQEGHFYAGRTIENHAKAHGDRGRYPYRQELQTALELWTGYEALAAYANDHGIQIINATRGGFLDVFPRQTFESVMAAPASQAA